MGFAGYWDLAVVMEAWGFQGSHTSYEAANHRAGRPVPSGGEERSLTGKILKTAFPLVD